MTKRTNDLDQKKELAVLDYTNLKQPETASSSDRLLARWLGVASLSLGAATLFVGVVGSGSLNTSQGGYFAGEIAPCMAGLTGLVAFSSLLAFFGSFLTKE